MMTTEATRQAEWMIDIYVDLIVRLSQEAGWHSSAVTEMSSGGGSNPADFMINAIERVEKLTPEGKQIIRTMKELPSDEYICLTLYSQLKRTPNAKTGKLFQINDMAKVLKISPSEFKAARRRGLRRLTTLVA